MGALVVIYVAIIVLMIASLWKIYSKAGQPGWACIIPIYGTIVWLKIINKPIWWFILLLIPLVNIVILIIMYIQMAKVFGKGTGFGLGLIFFGIIFLPILAFGGAEYQKTDASSSEEAS